MKNLSLIINAVLIIACISMSNQMTKLNEKVGLLTVLFEDSQNGEALQGQLHIDFLMELEALRKKSPDEASIIANIIICDYEETLDVYLELPTLSDTTISLILQTKKDVIEFCGN